MICTAHSTLFEKNEMDGACRVYGGEEKRIQRFGGETCGKVTVLKTQSYSLIH